MRRQLGEEKNKKSKVKNRPRGAEFTPEKTLSTGTPADSKIEPADFFDPEEFGYRRKIKIFQE